LLPLTSSEPKCHAKPRGDDDDAERDEAQQRDPYSPAVRREQAGGDSRQTNSANEAANPEIEFARIRVRCPEFPSMDIENAYLYIWILLGELLIQKMQ
jgi:hypothetical protein